MPRRTESPDRPCMASDRSSEPEPLLARQHAVDPALLLGSARVQRRQRLRELPEARILAHALLDHEALERLGSPGAEEEHGLVEAVERGLADLGRPAIA